LWSVRTASISRRTSSTVSTSLLSTKGNGERSSRYAAAKIESRKKAARPFLPRSGFLEHLVLEHLVTR
jgi:hypothetical protein